MSFVITTMSFVITQNLPTMSFVIKHMKIKNVIHNKTIYLCFKTYHSAHS
jgi:hypothetical protein